MAAGTPACSSASQFNLLVNLCFLDRHAEAAPMARKVRELTERIGNDLDLVRLRWLEGRIAAGLHQPKEAVASFEEVRADFAARGIAYDAALVSLELAVLYLEEGRTGKVKTLAEEMLWIFRDQGISREALAALQVFYDAARRDAVSIELTRRVIDDLSRASLAQKVRLEAEDSPARSTEA